MGFHSAMSRFRSQALEAEHNLGGFNCGEPNLDEWLHRQALRAQTQGWAKTQVWVDAKSKVIAYYSVAPTLITSDGVSRRVRGGISTLPGYLLARLALDQSLQGQGLGWDLLWDALETICTAAALGGGRVIVVDPINPAAALFYQHHGFTTIKGSKRLIMLVSAAQASINQLRN
jgi:GNAT superfamily N-acetyltransferase